MKRMLTKLWRDDQGAVISSELVLVLGIGTFGVIPGLVALRDTVNKGLASFIEPLKTVTDSAAKSAASVSQSQVNVNSATATAAASNVVNVYNILPPSP